MRDRWPIKTLHYWMIKNRMRGYATIRERTRREAKEAMEATGSPEEFGKIVKIVFHYEDMFDLISQATNEDTLYEAGA